MGSAPSEQAAVMLQRLPSLGRIGSDSSEVQFVDMYILDGFRALNVAESLSTAGSERSSMFEEAWQNGLDELGQRLLARDATIGSSSMADFVKDNKNCNNKTLISDMVAALFRSQSKGADFGSTELKDLTFTDLSLAEAKVRGLTLVDCMFNSLELPLFPESMVEIKNGFADRVIGISSSKALPETISLLDGARYDEVGTVSKIREIGLNPAQEIFVTIIKKTFFQKGTGRKEEALVRGLSRHPGRKVHDRVLNILLREGVLTRFKGDEGWVYSPNRSDAAGRMSKILDELTSSNDPLWIEISSLSR